MSAIDTIVGDRNNRDNALKSLYDDIHTKHMFPFWATSTDVAHDEIKQLMGSSKANPFLWSYDRDIEPILNRAAELVTMDDSERRSLILVNPGLAPKRATVSTMYTAYRLNDANEIMPPHRHSPNAIRFGLTGKGNFTGVEGEDITFGPGDMVLTPIDTWHNHGTIGNEPVSTSPSLICRSSETSQLNLLRARLQRDRGRQARPEEAADGALPLGLFAAHYGNGGLMPRFVRHNRGAGLTPPMYVYRWEMMRDLLERHKRLGRRPL